MLAVYVAQDYWCARMAADLFALRFLTAFRVPWSVHLRLPERTACGVCSEGHVDIIRGVLEDYERERERRGDWAAPPGEGEDVAMPRPAQDGPPSEQIEGKDAGGESVEATRWPREAMVVVVTPDPYNAGNHG
eukprot:Skav233288  [mRNA]  locus=scaffold4120:220060:223805:+ [translate_table: standard]